MDIADFLTYAGPAFIVLAVLLLVGGVLLVERVAHRDEGATPPQDPTP